MKKRFRVLLPLLAVLLLTQVFLTASASASNPPEELRGVWIASVYNIDFPLKKGLSPEEMKGEIDAIMDNTKSMNLNAVFFQVRPAADALYRSSVFPWSEYLTGTQGKAPQDSFDPLAYAVESAHKRGISFHAWINPFKVTRGSAANPNTDLSKLASSNPAVQSPGLVKAYKGELFFDPGDPKTQEIILSGVKEIVENYDVDGIHYDDYFYPGRDFDDAATYTKYGSNFQNIGDFRRANISRFIADSYQLVKRLDPSVQFGVSPFAVWANKKNHALGSDTQGGVETYYDMFADTRSWVKEGLLDYIAPQIYWNIGFKAADYKTLLAWWSEVVRDTNVKLYTGNAAYKVGDGSQSAAWLDGSEIPNQIELNRKTGNISGSIFYGYANLKNNALGVKDSIAALFSSDPDAYKNLGTLEFKNAEYPKVLQIARPANNLKTTYAKVSIQGSSNPNFPLTVNGETVATSKNGFWNLYVELKNGTNTFTFKNGSEEKILTIQKGASGSGSSGGGYVMKTPEFQPGTFSPSSSITRMKGESVNFACVAPAGAKVYVQIGSYRLDLKQKTTASGDTLAAATYEGLFTMPAAKKSGTTELGKPIFYFEYKGKTYKSEQKNVISVVSGAPDRHVTVKKPDAPVRTGPSSSYARLHPLAKGTQAGITGVSGDYYRIETGGWIYKDNVTVTKKSLPANKVESFKTTPETNGYTEVRLKMPVNAPYSVKKEGAKLVLTIYNTKSIAPPTLKENAAISGVVRKSAASDPHTIYEFNLKDSKNFLGYFVEFKDSGLVVGVKLPPKAAGSGAKPLSGAHILLDPGHGGSDPGALGPAGSLSQTEDDVVLLITLRAKQYLEAKGAKVTITRTTDKNVPLEDRADLIRKEKPDLAISVHANSMGDNIDLDTIDGLMVLYTEDHSKGAAEYFHNYLTTTLARTKKNARYQSLAVCRVTHTPAILVEAGFMSNVAEYEYLTTGENQYKMGTAIGQAAENFILSYKK